MPYFQSKLDGQQVLQNSHDESHQALRHISITSLITGPWDYMTRTVNSNVETYVFKNGGSSGTTTCTITLTYTDSTLASLSTLART